MSRQHFVVKGPPRWKRSVHTSIDPALAAAKRCSVQFPNAVCTITEGLPGMQHVVAECNRDECWRTSNLARRPKRRRRRKARR